MCCESRFLEALHDRGLRLTPQRERILAILHEMDGHATAEQIYERIVAQNPSMDISTVYRTLELLQMLQMVGCIDVGGQRRYELLSLHGAHHHLYCRICGQLLRVEAQEMQPLIEHLAQLSGFEADPEHLIIPGLCEECRHRVAVSP
ncbi:MAG: transcriptional repressor [Chloroflexi bacterium]|nr:transcriptional repressor [Chloroflexota bacterium]